MGKGKFFGFDEEMLQLWEELYGSSTIKKEKEFLKKILQFVKSRKEEFDKFCKQ